MRQVRNPQIELGEVRIEDIELNLKSRDDIPALLLGLQHLYRDDRTRLFALLDRHILPGTDRTVGRPGMEIWRILVMGVIKQGLGCDFDRLQEVGERAQDAAPFSWPCGCLGRLPLRVPEAERESSAPGTALMSFLRKPGC